VRGALAQFRVGEPRGLADEGLGVRRSLRGSEQAEREVQVPATSAMASTIGV
jgi:hypothetical protein